MKTILITGVLCLALSAGAQDIHYNYDRSVNFYAYKTYQWVDSKQGPADQLVDQNIKRAVDAQLAGKGLRRIDSGADLEVRYQIDIWHEKQFDGYGPAGPRWYGPSRVTSSTINIGKLIVSIVDPAKRQLVWRGDASKTVSLNKDPDKNYRQLEKTVSKLFKNYPTPAKT
jgi:hypothetical protein